MQHRASVVALATAAVLAAVAPAEASSLPRAEIGQHPYFGLGLGNGVSLSFDAPLNADMALGASIGTGLVYSKLNNVDVRFLYKLVRGGAQMPWIDLLLGVQGGGPGYALGGFEPTVGVASAYAFTPRITLRLNLVVGVQSRGSALSGIELGYKFTPRLEGTFGVNGRGDLFGLKYNL